MKLLLYAILAIYLLSDGLIDGAELDLEDKLVEEDVAKSVRDDKLFSFIKIHPEQCNTGDMNAPNGTCLDYKSCHRIGGRGTTSCAKGFGTCCLVQNSCGGTTKSIDSFFISPNFPQSFTGICQLTVDRANDNICQIRIDFQSFTLAQPTADEGICMTDMFTVTGGVSTVPTLCGDNDGQHIYVDFNPSGSPLIITVNAAANTMSNSRFNFEITQIPCNSQERAPSGCLQYYTSTSGNVKSFNFPSNPKVPLRESRTTQLSNTAYTICVRQEAGFCSISWSPDTSMNVQNFNFFVTGAEQALQDDLFGDISAVQTTMCTTDYVVVPGGQFTDLENNEAISSTFCGAAFPNPVTSIFTPFQMFVRTDAAELANANTGNFGFSLNFRQNMC